MKWEYVDSIDGQGKHWKMAKDPIAILVKEWESGPKGQEDRPVEAFYRVGGISGATNFRAGEVEKAKAWGLNMVYEVLKDLIMEVKVAM